MGPEGRRRAVGSTGHRELVRGRAPTELDPDITQARIPRGARILLSSDGLHDVVEADEILELAEIVDVDEAVQRMVERANALGGPDNITALLVEP